MKRRNFLQTAALSGVIPLCTGGSADHIVPVGQTPALSASEQEAIATALGKKGTYNEAEATYTVALPRNDLKVTVKGESVPIPFGFGGWVSLKKQLMAKKPC